MQYVRSISGSVSKTWNSINPATLSGAIDVIVVEQEDGTLGCSPFHVRFGKFSLLRPSEKKVEFRVNDVKQNFAMKLGEEGEAFFVFETTDNIPEFMQTSPLVSPTSSPQAPSGDPNILNLSEPDFLELDTVDVKSRPGSPSRMETGVTSAETSKSILYNFGSSVVSSDSHEFLSKRFGPKSSDETCYEHSLSENFSPFSERSIKDSDKINRGRLTRSLTPSLPGEDESFEDESYESHSLRSLPTKEAINRAKALSERLSASNIPTQVTGTGDLMLDMTGYKSSEDDALRAEVIARKILSDELEGNCNTGALIGIDENGNLWIYSSEEAKEAARNNARLVDVSPHTIKNSDTMSDLDYQSEEETEISTSRTKIHHRSGYSNGLETPPKTPERVADQNHNYAKTLRLTSEQLKTLGLKSGPNPMSFSVNRAMCQAYMYLWRYDVPIVISDIDGTITKSDTLGHVLNMIGRDWTHIGVAKLYTEIVNNGYNIMYLTSRSIGQADTTRAYLNGVVQESFRLPKGPTIMSPDRTIAALRRELYIRKPEVFKMACLRDIKNLFGQSRAPFYAGFGNRFTDALSYRSVSIPSNRIFTINSCAEVCLDLLSLNKLRYSYVNMREVVDHYFPPVNTLVRSGGEEYTDFTYWREPILDIDNFSDSDSEEDEDQEEEENEDEEDEEEEEEEEDEDDDDDDDDVDEDIYDDEDSLNQIDNSFISRDYTDESNEDYDASTIRSPTDLSEDEESDDAASRSTETNESAHQICK